MALIPHLMIYIYIYCIAIRPVYVFFSVSCFGSNQVKIPYFRSQFYLILEIPPLHPNQQISKTNSLYDVVFLFCFSSMVYEQPTNYKIRGNESVLESYTIPPTNFCLRDAVLCCSPNQTLLYLTQSFNH